MYLKLLYKINFLLKIIFIFLLFSLFLTKNALPQVSYAKQKNLINAGSISTGMGCIDLYHALGGSNKISWLWLGNKKGKHGHYVLLESSIKDSDKIFYLCEQKRFDYESSDSAKDALKDHNLIKIYFEPMKMFTYIFQIASEGSTKYILQRLTLSDYNISRPELITAFALSQKKQLKESKTKTTKQAKKKSTKKTTNFQDLPDAEFYFYAFKGNQDYFIGYLNQDPNSKMVKKFNRKFRKGNLGIAYKNDGGKCKVYSEVDIPKSNNRTYTGVASVKCKDGSKYIGNWVQYGSKGSGKGIDASSGESIDFYFTMSKALAIGELYSFKQSKKLVAEKPKKVEKKEKKIALSEDKDPPIIKIADTHTFNDKSYILKGTVKDKSRTVYVEVDGINHDVNKKGEFAIKRYSPTNEEVEIIAIDKWGNTSKKLVKIKIELATEVAEKLDKLNPANIKKQQSNNNRLALIIGIEKYESAPPAVFAKNDAKYFYEYARLAFGIKESNIKLLIDEDTTLVKTYKAIDQWLTSKIEKNRTELIIFYAGHGLATPDGKDLYFLLRDSDTDLLKRTALSKTAFFADIEKLKPKSVTIFIDSCYSGSSRDNETLLASARPIKVVGEETDTPRNFTIFSASGLDQISSGLKEAKHGIFSYYLMKGLEGKADKNKDRKITNGELQEYLTQNVSRKALEIGRQQEPSLSGNTSKVLIKF